MHVCLLCEQHARGRSTPLALVMRRGCQQQPTSPIPQPSPHACLPAPSPSATPGLPKFEGPPSETQLRRDKFKFYEVHCSQVAPGLFLAGDVVAKDREAITRHGITHVLNCVGFICKEYFQGELHYKTYYLQGERRCLSGRRLSNA